MVFFVGHYMKSLKKYKHKRWVLPSGSAQASCRNKCISIYIFFIIDTLSHSAIREWERTSKIGWGDQQRLPKVGDV